MRLLTIGDNTIDRYRGAMTGERVGGNALKVAMNLALAGYSVVYAGAVGSDDAGDHVVDVLRSVGIDTSHVVRSHLPTASTDVRVLESGERVFEAEHYGATGEYRPDGRLLASVGPVDAIHLGYLADVELLYPALATTNALVSQDCAVTPQRGALGIAFISGGDGDSQVARSLAESAVAQGAALAVVTLGSAGSAVYDAADWYECAAAPTIVVDTTGAGDSYIAEFIAQRCNIVDIETAMRAASIAAAATCSHWGAWATVNPGNL